MTDLVIEESPVDFVSIIHLHAMQIGCHLRSKLKILLNEMIILVEKAIKNISGFLGFNRKIKK